MAKDAKWYASWVRSAYAQTAEEKLTNLEAADCIEALAAELEAVKRERGAAIMDLENASRCESCKYCLVSVREEPCCDCGCIIDGLREKWEWRGLCVENGGAK